MELNSLNRLNQLNHSKSMRKTALIDGDFICYKVCPNSKKQEEPKTLQQTLDLVDWYLNEKIFIPTNIEEYVAYLGGKGNFRYFFSDTYKSGRSSERPPFFREVRDYLVGKLYFHQNKRIYLIEFDSNHFH